jgi:hypothetical protein
MQRATDALESSGVVTHGALVLLYDGDRVSLGALHVTLIEAAHALELAHALVREQLNRGASRAH